MLRVRAYDQQDRGFITALAEEAFLEYTPHAPEHTLKMAERLVTLVAVRGESNEAPIRVGFIAVEFVGRRLASLQAIAVVERERGRGVGQALMRTFERMARERGVRQLELCTAESNLAALDLFFKCGFEIRRRHSRFYARGQNACVLVKELRSSSSAPGLTK